MVSPHLIRENNNTTNNYLIMANKRNLKKQVRYICGDLATECLIAAEYVKDIDKEKMRDIVARIAVLQENALKNISFSFDKVPSDFTSLKDYNTARAKYFRQAFHAYHSKFNSRVMEIVKEMNAALPAEAKEANKKNA